MSIPENRAVLGRDLKEIKQLFGLSTQESCYLFGLSITKWTTIVNQQPDTPLSDPSLALLVRFLAIHPELSIIPKSPTATEMFDLIHKVIPMNAKEFSVFFGSEGSAYNRWKKNISRQGPSIQRLLYYFKLAIMGRPMSEQVTLLNSWKNTVKSEGAARGVIDVFKTGQWRPREAIEGSKLSVGAKAGAAKARQAKEKLKISSAGAKPKLKKPSSSKR